MASMKFYSLMLVVFTLASAPRAAVAGDPDILTDFITPTPHIGLPIVITGDYFTYTGFDPMYPRPVAGFSVQKASMAEFPALNGQSVSYAKLLFLPGTVNPTHTHPRAAELLLVIEGALSVGFIDMAGKLYQGRIHVQPRGCTGHRVCSSATELYTKDLVEGDMFVFPKGLVHYQSNQGPRFALALSAFGSASAGTVSVPVTVFGTKVDDAVLAKSFKTDLATVHKLKAALTPPLKH